MANECEILRRLLKIGRYVTTKQLDAILLEFWGNEYDAQMHCNSMMRRGLIDYESDGDWEILISEQELEE
jgi:hypothetical protein